MAKLQSASCKRLMRPAPCGPPFYSVWPASARSSNPDVAGAGDQPLGYRNKLVWQAQRREGSIRLGYAMGRRGRVLDVTACPLAHPAINAAAAVWRRSRWFDKLRTGDRVTFRHTPVNGAIAWINAAPDNAVWLRENTPLGPISVPRQAFFQVNPVVSDRLIEWVRARIQESDMAFAVDLYCAPTDASSAACP